MEMKMETNMETSQGVTNTDLMFRFFDQITTPRSRGEGPGNYGDRHYGRDALYVYHFKDVP